jgi:hypothetical protein
MLEPGERLGLELPDTLPCEADLLADRLQRPWLVVSSTSLAARLFFSFAIRR